VSSIIGLTIFSKNNMSVATPLLLDAELAAFLRQDGLSITAGSCGADLRPSVIRAVGCRIAADGSDVRIFVSGVQAAPLLAHVRETGRLAAVFSRPTTHRTLQLKGRDAHVVPVAGDDLAIVARFRDTLVAELDLVGLAPPLIRTLLACPDQDIVGIRFTPIEAYSQTPGPDAGRALQVAR
jgi:hypothetical protein